MSAPVVLPLAAAIPAAITEGVNIIGDIAAALQRLSAGSLALGAFREQVGRDFAAFNQRLASLEDSVAAVWAEGDRMVDALPESHAPQPVAPVAPTATPPAP